MTENNFWDDQEENSNWNVRIEIIKYIRFAWGEHQLKKWFEKNKWSEKTKKFVRQDIEKKNIDWKTPFEGFASIFKSSKSFTPNSLAQNAVDALGEKACLELLEKWWNEKAK